MAKRRQWIEDLKQSNGDPILLNKKQKIQILSDETYKAGKLIRTTKHQTETELDSDDVHSTPHHRNHNNILKELTPTFRDPDTYIEKTEKILMKITPRKSYLPILENNPLSMEDYEISESSYYKEDLGAICGDNNIIRLDDQDLQFLNVSLTISPESEKNTNMVKPHPIRFLSSVSPKPGTSSETVKDPSISATRSTSPIPGMSTDITVNDPSVSATRSTSPIPGTSSETVKDPSISATRSTSPIPGMSTDITVNDPSVSATRSTSPIPGTSSETANDPSISASQNTSPIPGMSTDIIVNDPSLSATRSSSPKPGTSSETVNDPSIFALRSTSPKRKNKLLRNCKKQLHFDKSFIDFVDEDEADMLLNEAFPSDDSENWSDQDNISSSDSSEHKKNSFRKKKNNTNKENRHKKVDIIKGKKKKDLKKENTIKRQQGKSYISAKGNLVEEKKMSVNPCIGKKCRNNCGNIPEERRQRLFEFYWNLQNHQRRKDWISQAIVKKCVKNRSQEIQNDTPSTSRRSVTYEYYINEGEIRRQVCQQFLIATLNITQRFILYTAETTKDGFPKLDARGKHGSHNKTPLEITQHAHSFIMSLPLLPSHYCRKDSKKLYLPEDIKNITNLHNIYLKRCEEENVKSMSFKVFNNFFETNFNIGFHIPKKDKCIVCAATKTYDVATEEEIEKIERHLKDKEESQNRFHFHQRLHENDKTMICASFDLQKVLNTPHGKNMALYYSRKIAVYNFTIYESGTQYGLCNIWTECDAHRGANEISSCLLNYIKDIDRRQHVKTLLLYSDSCFGQNKNKTVLAMLRYALTKSENLEVIQINYLLPGHTYMPVDSMHAVIERAVRNTTIWAPSHWPTVIEMSRKKPFPYKVAVLTGCDFMGFDDIVNKTYKKSQKLMMSQIRVVTFKKSCPNVMLVKNSMSPEANCVEVGLGALGNEEPKPNVYPAKLPISFKKYNDLKKLVEKRVIPSNCASEYLSLKYGKKTVDCLPDTDEED